MLYNLTETKGIQKKLVTFKLYLKALCDRAVKKHYILIYATFYYLLCFSLAKHS